MGKFVLRKTPFFEIVLNEDSFEINNTDYISNNGIYHFEELKSVELLESKTDWFPTVLGNLIGLISGHIGREETADRLVFKFHSGKKMEVKLIECDLETVSEIINEFKKIEFNKNTPLFVQNKGVARLVIKHFLEFVTNRQLKNI